LDERSEQLAVHLAESGLRCGQVAGLMMERSPDIIIAILAILKTGAAYVPIDPQLPGTRIKAMLESTKAALVVINEPTAVSSELGVTLIDMAATETWAGKGDCKDIVISPEDLCYILYTSGSTGTPKGAQIRHNSVVNLISSLANRYELSPAEDKILLFSNIVFDASVMQMWLALLYGNTLVIPSYETLLDENAFNSVLEESGVTHLFMTPSFLENIDFRPNAALKRIEIGGEALKPTLLAKIPEEIALYNCYGPTEATVMATSGMVTRGKGEASKISLGTPLHNTNLLILDQDRQLVPMGVDGELYIGGLGVGNGYINDEKLTAKSFVPNPFAPKQIIYRTGDIVRREKEGTISFVGRKDDQVKFRGYRLELGDIENCLRSLDFVKEALVILRTDFGQDYLAAYIIPDDPSLVLDQDMTQELKKQIVKQLPPYMVPQHFTLMEAFPLTLSGKLDKRKLPVPEQTADEITDTPATDTELKVRSIWSAVLNIPEEKISIEANFFTLGGHSLKAAFLINSINETFGVNVSLKEFFARQDVSSLSAYIDGLERSDVISVPKAADATDYPLSSAQKRLYFLHAFDGESLAYNLTQTFIFRGNVDLPKVNETLSRLVARHESLRTAIRLVDGEPRQFIVAQPDFQVEVFESEAACLAGLVRPFDIEKAPLFRAG
ncbi:MAG: amino acid adenylation domain-containing protein, partial [Bacteroidota bacterium]